jgi:hypothetical protein
MKKLGWALPGLALVATLAGGCIILSGQIFAHFSLTNPLTIDSSAGGFDREFVDLNTVKEYKDHKDKLAGLSDLAVVGTFKNLSGPAGSVEIWITAGNTNLATIPGIHSSATKLWGPANIGASPASLTINWNDSAKLFSSAGKKILIDEALGGGTFTLYIIGTAATYQIEVDKGELILVIAAKA